MTPILLTLVGTLAVAFALLVLRADPRRWDNRAFAVLTLLDATMALFRGVAGLFVISVVSAVVGYVLASVGWDAWIRLRWRRKIRRARDKRLEASTSDTVAG